MLNLPEPKEAEVQKMIMHYLGLKGYVHFRNNTGAHISTHNGKQRFIRFGMVGSGDIIGLTKEGRFFSIEVKRKNTHPTDHQKNFINRVAASGGLAFVARSLDDVINNGL